MITERALLELGLWTNLYVFVWKAFLTLHPSQAFIPSWQRGGDVLRPATRR